VSRPRESESGPDPPAGLPRDEAFDVLRNQRRRFVLHHLTASDGAVELGDLATRVAAWENDVGPEAVTADQRKRVYTTLQQSHLPRLDEAGIVEYDADRGVVSPTDRASDLSIYLEVVPDEEFAWHEYYLGLGAVCLALMVAVWAGAFAFVPAVIWGTVISLALLASAAVHASRQRRMALGADGPPAELAFEDREG